LVDHARTCGAYGAITVSESNCDVELYFESVANAGSFLQFVSVVAEESRLLPEQIVSSLALARDPVSLPEDLDLVAKYEGREDSLEAASNSTAGTTSIAKLPKGAPTISRNPYTAEVVHLLPKALLKQEYRSSSSAGPAPLSIVLGGTRTLNVMSDAEVPLVRFSITDGAASASGTTSMTLLMRCASDGDLEFLLSDLTKPQHLPNSTVGVSIEYPVADLPAFKEVLTWRELSVNAATALRNKGFLGAANNKGKYPPWWALVPGPHRFETMMTNPRRTCAIDEVTANEPGATITLVTLAGECVTGEVERFVVDDDDVDKVVGVSLKGAGELRWYLPKDLTDADMKTFLAPIAPL
jgi:hypothetical protein